MGVGGKWKGKAAITQLVSLACSAPSVMVAICLQRPILHSSSCLLRTRLKTLVTSKATTGRLGGRHPSLQALPYTPSSLQIRSLLWSSDDSHLISCGMDGAIYDWNVQNVKRERECVIKSCSYTSIAITPDLRTTFAVGSDRTLKEVILADSTVSSLQLISLSPLSYM